MTGALLFPISFAILGGTRESSEPDKTEQGHSSGLTARIVMADGTNRTARLEGVGCTVSICSRVAIEGKSENKSPVRSWLDAIAEIRDTTANDALFVMKDGTARRLSLMKDFRVLYLATRISGTEKLDLAKVKSVEFLASVK